jgi:NAD(P)-dependent dehydrogenase (short-subunit alcohol dehydrogenase family)
MVSGHAHYGRKVHTNIRSVSDSTQIQETLKTVVKDFGKIDVFVANAGKIPLPVMSVVNADLDERLQAWPSQSLSSSKHWKSTRSRCP